MPKSLPQQTNGEDPDVVPVKARPVEESTHVHVWSKSNPLGRVYHCPSCNAVKVSTTGTRP